MGVFFDGFAFEPHRFELRHNGELIAMEPQVVDVLAYLIEHRDRVVSKEELLDNIWGDRFVSESALTSRIKAVRRALGDDGTSQRFVQTTRGRGYRFIADLSPPPDGAGAGDVAARDRGSPATGPPPGTATFLVTGVDDPGRVWEQQPAQLQVALARHDALLRSAIEKSGGLVFSTAGGSVRAVFAAVGPAVEAARLGQRSLDAEEWPSMGRLRVRMGLHVGEAHARGGDYFGAALNKAAHVMAAGHGGQTLVSAAVAAVCGSAELVDLGQHRLQDLTAAEHLHQLGPGSFPPLRTLEAVRHNLPVERTLLVGREHEIGQVSDLVRSHRLVTLLGIGGTGKTRLATAVAAAQAERFHDGIWFVDLVPATTRDQVAEAIANAAGLQLNQSDLVRGLSELIADRQMLFVLDNCEHITDQVVDVVDVLLERTGAPRWLATSREPLQLPDERQVHVAPLAVDNGIDAPAVQLFAAAAERVGVVVNPDDVAVIADICGHLDGLPLSIELAAAQLRHLSLHELAGRLDQRFEILARGRGGRLRRQASLQAVLEDTWAMLDDHETELLLQLAAFPSGFTIGDVEAVCAGVGVGVPTLTLAGLVDRSLVTSDGHGRHRLLETVKLFARQRWSDHADPDVYLERHTRWVLGYLNSFAPQDWYTSFTVLAWAKAHYDDHRAVEDRLAHGKRSADLVALFRALTQTYCYETGTRASAVIERIERLLEELDLSARERGLLNLVAATAGLPARRPDWIDRGSRAAVPLLRSDGAPEELAAALTIGSWMTVFRDFDLAVSMLGEARAVAERANAPALADVALAYLAGHHALGGDIDHALRLLGELRERVGNRPFDYAGSLLGLFSLAVNVIADPLISRAEGEKLTGEFAHLAGDAGIGWGLPLCNCVAVAACGDIGATRRAVAEAEALTRLTSSNDGLPDLLLPPAALAWRLGDTAAARRWLTAVRSSPKPTQNFHITIMYRQLRNQVGPLKRETLTAHGLQEVYAEALAWMAGLTPVGRAR